MNDDEKQRFVALQLILWITYSVCAVVAHLDIESPWSLALVLVAAVAIPLVSGTYYYILPATRAPRLARKLVQSLWIATTTAALFLFGVCTFLEGQSEPFAGKLGAGIYVFTIVWSHTGLYQDGTDPKTGENNLFTAYVAISGVVYTTTAFFLAFHPSFAPWRLALPVASIVGLLGWLSFFSGHFQGFWSATVLLVFVACLPVFLYGFALGDLEQTSYSDSTELDLALTGLVVLFVTLPVAHWWIGDKHNPDGNTGKVPPRAPIGSLFF